MAGRRQETFKAEWIPFDGMPKAFSLVGAKGTLYWRGKVGWWAQRPGTSGMQGPFSRDYEARRWAEEPLRQAFERKAQARADKAAAQEAQREAALASTWGALPPEARKLRPGQVWAMKAEAFQEHLVLIVELRKESVLALVRSDRKPWGICPKDVRSHHALLHLYRYQGEAKVPKAALKKA